MRGGLRVRNLLNLIDRTGRVKLGNAGWADDTVLELFGDPLAGHQTQTGGTFHLIFETPPKKIF